MDTPLRASYSFPFSVHERIAREREKGDGAYAPAPETSRDIARIFSVCQV